MFVTTKQLREAFGITPNDKLKETLAMNNVRFFTRRDGLPFTTIAALNEALGTKDEHDDGFNIEALNE